MGWASGVNSEGREVGYSVEAVCDQDGCDVDINRGLAYCCGDMHDGGEHGCGGYFCYEHLTLTGHEAPGGESPGVFLCEACTARWEAEHPDPDGELVADLVEDLMAGSSVAVDGRPVVAVVADEEEEHA